MYGLNTFVMFWFTEAINSTDAPQIAPYFISRNFLKLVAQNWL